MLLLFQAQVPEKLIQQRTGHRSLDALRQYERTSAAQLLDVSNVMSGTSDPSSSVSLAPKKVNATWAILPAVKEQTQNQVNSNQSIPLLPTGFQSTPMFIVNGRTFSGCSVAISGQQPAYQPSNTEEFTEEQICQETLKDVDIDDIFD